jgi:uncharacterized protein YggU (UPF0235/DUF167 family)
MIKNFKFIQNFAILHRKGNVVTLSVQVKPNSKANNILEIN